MRTDKLPGQFIGIGEVKGDLFLKIIETDKGYVFLRSCKGSEKYHYEVFRKKTTPIAVNFKKRIFSETHVKEIYPRSKNFSVWAWSVRSHQETVKKLNELWTK